MGFAALYPSYAADRTPQHFRGCDHESNRITLDVIVKLNIYLVAEVDQDAVPKLRAIRDRYVNVEKPPASTLVVVSRLARPGWLIEIEAVATIDA